jgi:hypothetical protein
MRDRELRSRAARLCVLLRDQRRVIAVLATCAVALTALISSHAAFEMAPARRDRPFRAATVATQGANEHTVVLNESCFAHHGFEVELNYHGQRPFQCV